ncbi:MAG TPA: cyanophycin synthetase, partial [Flavobacteriales bacterium]|nr:cyanophycin synthetase [Flavobacteriales bacterium]
YFGKNHYAVFGYQEEEVGIEAAHKALEIVNAVCDGKPSGFKEAKSTIQKLRFELHPGPSTNAIIEAALRRNIPVRKIAGGKFVILGQGKYQRKIEASICDSTSNVSVDIACDKQATKRILAEALIPVPEGTVVQSEAELIAAVEKTGFPLVTKPIDGHHGNGITGNIRNYNDLVKGFWLAKKHSDSVIVEKFIQGNDYRFLVVGYKVVAVAQRIPAMVIGDGVSTVAQLVQRVNDDPCRGEGHEKNLTKITIDTQTLELLAAHNMTLESIPAKNEVVHMKFTANLSTGGTAVDVTDELHLENRWLAERAAKLIGLNICGIDIMAPVIKTPLTENGGVILEVNAAPGLRMHITPAKGKPRNVGDPIVDLMFPRYAKSRIPIVAVTGTNGKTTTTRLMAYMADAQGFHVGFTCTDGIYVDHVQIDKGDCSGSKSATVVLNDPTVDFAVLECARGGIIRSGLAFDCCDVGILTNVASDHLGLKGIDTLEDLARVKAVVPMAVNPEGYAILNSADDLVYDLRNQVSAQVALFGLEMNHRIKNHCANGGLAAFLDHDRNIVIAHGQKEMIVENVANIPVTFNGLAEFMIENVLPVVLACYAQKFDMKKVRAALRTFEPSPTKLPGRINIIKINDVNVMVDYGHNAHGYIALGNMLKKIDAVKTGIVTGVGDRRDEDIVEIGQIAAGIFDKIIVRVDDDTRGRSVEEISSLIIQGIRQSNAEVPCDLIPETLKALRFAIENSNAGDYVIITPEDPEAILAFLEEMQNATAHDAPFKPGEIHDVNNQTLHSSNGTTDLSFI